MMENNLFLLNARRKEYLATFQRLSVGYFLNIVYDIYGQVKKANKIKKFLLKEFQASLVGISTWDDATKEYKGQNASLLEKLMNGIFKLDIVLRHELSKNAEKHIPSLNEFVYQCLLNFARVIWKNPMLVYDVGIDKLVIQTNKLKLEKLVSSVIKDTFTYYLPFDIDDVVEEPEPKEEEFEQEHETEVMLNTKDEHEEHFVDEDEDQDEAQQNSDNESEEGDDSDKQSSVFNIETNCEDADEDEDGVADEDCLDDMSQVDNEDLSQSDIVDDASENDDLDDVDTTSNQDEEPLIHDSHVPIPRYDGAYHHEHLNAGIDQHTSEPVNVSESIKNVYIDEKHKNTDNTMITDSGETIISQGDIKVVNINEKGAYVLDNGIVDKVQKKNSLLAIKKKVKSQIFVEKRENKRIGGASFF
jgi:hypothetical protein